MKVRELKQLLELEVLNESDGDRDVTGGYAGDLLSWVMGRAQYGDAWITIMTNLNVLAVASLADVACVIVAEDAEVTPDLIEVARTQQINLFRSPKTTFALCAAVAQLLV